MDKLIGTVLDGRYIIREIIGTGGMSIVYRAEDVLEDRNVAVKVLKEEFVSDLKFRRRFLNESRAIAMLSHENIVDVVDVCFEGPVQYIVMEYIEGKTLKDYMAEKGVLGVDEALGYTTQILRALEHAHERGIVHRDIKPQNIMLLENGRIKVTDFGIAHVSSNETVTMSEMAIGSVHYISPEQAKGHATDEKSDLYSTGVVLYEMVTGQLPFDSDTAVSVALMQVQQTARVPSEIVPTLPKAIDQIVMKAMRKIPEERYQHASEMLADIEKYNENHEVVFPYDFSDETKAAPLPELFGEKKMNGKKKKAVSGARTRRRYNRILSLAIGIAAAVVLVVLGYRLMTFGIGALVGEYVSVPDFRGRDLSVVQTEYLADKNFKLEYEYEYNDSAAYGIILSQTPEPGKKIGAGETVTVHLSVSKGSQTTVVPEIVGLLLSDAKIRLTQNFLTYDLSFREDKTKPENTVLSCSPLPGETVPVGATISIVISTRSVQNTVSVPNVTGRTNTEAMRMLTEAGLLYVVKQSYSETYPAGWVMSQTPIGGEKVAPNTTITLYVSRGPIPTPDPVNSDGEETGSDGQETGSDAQEETE